MRMSSSPTSLRGVHDRRRSVTSSWTARAVGPERSSAAATSVHARARRSTPCTPRSSSCRAICETDAAVCHRSPPPPTRPPSRSSGQALHLVRHDIPQLQRCELEFSSRLPFSNRMVGIVTAWRGTPKVRGGKLRDAALVEFAARGFDGTTVGAIAATGRRQQGAPLQLLRGQEGPLGSRAGHRAGSPRRRGRDSPGRAWTTSASSPGPPSTITPRTLSSAGCCSGRACRTVSLRICPRATRHYREKVERFAAAQRTGVLDPALDPAHLVFTLIALAAWWQTVPQLAEMITGAGPDDDRTGPPPRLRRRGRTTTRKSVAVLTGIC